MMSSTRSSESAPRSSTKDALGVTSPSSTLSWSTMICFTLSSTPGMQTPPVCTNAHITNSSVYMALGKAGKARKSGHRSALLPAMTRSATHATLHLPGTGRRRWPTAVLIAKPRLSVLHGDAAPRDEYLLDIGFHIQGIAVGNHNIGRFADIERAQTVCHSPYFGRINGDGLQSFLIR